MRYWLIMPAAGVGRRFGEGIPKQYADLHGRAVIEWSLAPFLFDSRCLGVVVVLAAKDAWWPAVAARLPDDTMATQTSDSALSAVLADATRAAEKAAARSGAVDLDGFTDPALLLPNPTAVKLPKVITAPGGNERSGSVRNGLQVLASRAAPGDWVLVHDAARPCVLRQDIDRLLEQLQSHPVGGVLAAPAADTLKRAGEDHEIIQTVDRSSLWRALTPQMFRYGALTAALDQAFGEGRAPTDEAQALEWMGVRPVVVAGSTTNIKITSADDLVIAVALISARTAAAEDDNNDAGLRPMLPALPA